MIVRFKKLDPRAQVPKYARPGDAGMDLHALERVAIGAGEIVLIKTGIAMEIPDGYEGQVRGRSGMNKRGLWVPLGTIDSAYRGDIGVLVRNMNADLVWVEAGDRVGQLVIGRVSHAELVEVDDLSETERGLFGFGSSGR